MLITKINDESENQIQHLYDNVLKSNIDIKEYRKWYKEAPCNIYEYAAYDNDIIIGYKYLIERFNGKIKYYTSGGSQILPNYGTLFIPLLKEVEKYIKNNKGTIYGFCNKNSYKLFTSKLFNWDVIKDYFQLNITGIKTKVNDDIIWKEDDLNILNNNNKTQIASLNRDYEWLKWRLNKPNHKYKIYSSNNNNVLIMKEYNNFIDIMTILNCKDIIEYSKCIKTFFKQIISVKKKIINIICTNTKLKNILYKEFNVRIDEYERHLCIKEFQNQKSNNLFFELIDSDVF